MYTKEQLLEYRKKNREVLRVRSSKWVKKNSKKHKKSCKEWRKNNSTYMKNYYKRNPWARIYKRILSRVNGKNHFYSKKGIKNFLTTQEIKVLWFRDNAMLMHKASIHRIDNKQNYTYKNCKFIELKENIKLRGNYDNANKRDNL